MSLREILIRRVYKTGVQTVEREGDNYYLTIKNRSYQAEHQVPRETAVRYYYKMKHPDRPLLKPQQVHAPND